LKRKIKLSLALAVAVVIAVSTLVYASLLWNTTVPSNGITITSTTNALLFNDLACTVPTTAINFSPSLDALDLTNYTNGQTVYLKYVGSGNQSASFCMRIETGTLATGFSFYWKSSIDNTWRPLVEDINGTSDNFVNGLNLYNGFVFSTQIRAIQTASHSSGTFGTGLVIQYDLVN
jgi:hypothetical protein